MKNLLRSVGLFCALTFPFLVNGQQMMATKFILPDGKEIPANKLDSVKIAWNGERILFQHNDEDDKNHVMRLVRMTPEMAKMLKDMDEKRQKAMIKMTGKPAPNFSLRDLDGRMWTLSKLKGKIVVLNFWFTSCPPCIQEMPRLNELVAKYKGKDVIFLALTFNDGSSVRSFLRTHAFDYITLPASRETDKNYQISSWPASFVIGRDGNVKIAMGTDEQIFKALSKSIDAEH